MSVRDGAAGGAPGQIDAVLTLLRAVRFVNVTLDAPEATKPLAPAASTTSR
jgi:hypothetical protein